MNRICRLSLFLLFAVFSRPAFGQCPSDTIMWEDFQSQQIPGSWVNLDLDSLNDRNARPADWFIISDPISSGAGTTNYVAASNSWFNPAGQSHNLLITDALIVCDSNLFLVWKSAPFEGPVYMDGYEVLLSTTTPDPDSFTVSLKKFAEGIGATGQASAGTVHTQYDGIRGVLQPWRAALKPWHGDTVYLAFRHVSTDDNMIQLDDIGVVRLPEYDVLIPEVDYSTAYPIVPRSQVRPMQFTVSVRNEGINPLPEVVVDLQVTLGAQTVYNAADTLLNLAPLSSNAVTPATTFSPSQVGLYNLQATGIIDTTDGFPGNNSAALSFAVSDSVYARDEGNPAGTRNLGANAGFMGQTYRLFATDTLTSLSFYLDQPTGQDTLRGAVYAYSTVTNTPGALLAQTDPWPIPPGYTGWATLGLAGIDLPLNVGTYLVGAEESAGGELNLGWTERKATAGTVWHRVETSWASATALDLDGVYMVRANFGKVDEIVAADPAQGKIDFSISPNPGPGLFQVHFQSPLKSRTRLEVRDLTGRLLHAETLAGGQSTTRIDLSKRPNGIYLLSINDRAAGRLTVQR